MINPILLRIIRMAHKAAFSFRVEVRRARFPAVELSYNIGVLALRDKLVLSLSGVNEETTSLAVHVHESEILNWRIEVPAIVQIASIRPTYSLIAQPTIAIIFTCNLLVLLLILLIIGVD